MTTPTLTEFLLARIEEDEADMPTLGYTAHLTPERRVAECEAKRRIVEIHAPGSCRRYPQNTPPGNRRIYGCLNCVKCGDGTPCETLRTLAAIYADHPDYREEWRP